MSITVMPLCKFSVLKNVQATTQQSCIIQAKVMKWHNIALTVNYHISILSYKLQDKTSVAFQKLFYSFVYQTLS